METYTVRNKEGTMIAKLVGKPAEDIFKHLGGEWRTYETKNGKRTVCYEITRDSVGDHETPFGAMQIFLWEGTKVIKD